MESRTHRRPRAWAGQRVPPPAGVMEKCPECGFKASLTEAEAVVGKMGGHMPGVPTRDVLLSASDAGEDHTWGYELKKAFKTDPRAKRD